MLCSSVWPSAPLPALHLRHTPKRVSFTYCSWLLIFRRFNNNTPACHPSHEHPHTTSHYRPILSQTGGSISSEVKLEDLSKYFHLPEKSVAKEMGMCLTSLKKLCRSYGITRWPFRKLKSLERTMKKVRPAVEGLGGKCLLMRV